MKKLKTNVDFDKIDKILLDEKKYNSAVKFIDKNNRIKKYPFGFEYNGVTELIIELEPNFKIITSEVLPVKKYENEKKRYIIQEPTEEIKYLLKIFNFINIDDFMGICYYVSIIKLSETDHIERLNMLSYLFSNVDKDNFKISNIFLNIDKTEKPCESEESVDIISKKEDYLLIENEEEFLLSWTFAKSNGFGKYVTLYQLLENKLKRKNIKIEDVYELLDNELKAVVEDVYNKYKDSLGLSEYENIKMFKGVRNYLLHGSNFPMRLKLHPVMDELTKMLVKVVNKL
jgi:hypothetical protein